MIEPKVSWMCEDENGELVQLNDWNIKQIYSGYESDIKTIYLWNNKGDNYDDETNGIDEINHPKVATMQDVKITIITNDNESKDVVNRKWIQAKGLTYGLNEKNKQVQNDNDFTPIGLNSSYTLSAENIPHGNISGERNNGTKDDVKNYAKFQLKCVVPQDAKSATMKAMARIVYFYI